MKFFSWALVAAGIFVMIGAVEDPTGEKPIRSIIAGMLAGAVIVGTGFLTRKAWVSRQRGAAWLIWRTNTIGGIMTSPVIIDLFGEVFFSQGIMGRFLSAGDVFWWRRFLMSGSVLFLLYGILLANIIAFKNHSTETARGTGVQSH